MKTKTIDAAEKIGYHKERPRGQPVACGCCGHWLYFKKNNKIYIQCRSCGRQTILTIVDE